MKMISLYDYLGRAAGPELGKAVANAAARKKVVYLNGYDNINSHIFRCFLASIT